MIKILIKKLPNIEMDPDLSPELSESRFHFMDGEVGEGEFILEQRSKEKEERSVDEDSEFILNRLNATSQSLKQPENERKLKRDTKAESKSEDPKKKAKARKHSLKKGAFFPHNTSVDLLVQV